MTIDRGGHRLWAGDDVTYEGKYYRFKNLTIDPKPLQKPHPPLWIGGGTQPSEKVYAQTVKNIDPVLRRIAKYADTWVPHASSTPEMVKGDWDKVQRFAHEYGRDPASIGRVYNNFVWVLGKGETPRSAAARFSVYSGMDLEYWTTYYLLGTADEIAARINARIAALDGGVDTIVLNPLDWSLDQLERIAGEVLPRVARFCRVTSRAPRWPLTTHSRRRVAFLVRRLRSATVYTAMWPNVAVGTVACGLPRRQVGVGRPLPADGHRVLRARRLICTVGAASPLWPSTPWRIRVGRRSLTRSSRRCWRSCSSASGSRHRSSSGRS